MRVSGRALTRDRAGRLARSLLGLAALATLLTGAGLAEPLPPFDADAAIRESAERLCPSTAPGAGPATVTRIKSFDIYSQGFLYDTYEVRRESRSTSTAPASGPPAALHPLTPGGREGGGQSPIGIAQRAVGAGLVPARPGGDKPRPYNLPGTVPGSWVERASLPAQSAGRPSPRLTRLQVFTRGGSTIDLAATHDGERLTNLEPLRPVVLAGGAFPEFPRLASQLRGKPIESYAAGLARLFRALPAAAAFAAPGETPEAKPRVWTQYSGPQRPADIPAPLVRLWQKQLPMGAPLPALDPAGTAAPAVDATLAGREVAVLFGDIGDSVCRGMVRGFALAAPKRPALSVVAVLASSREAIGLWAKETTELAGKLPRLVPDPRKQLWKTFLPPLLPYFFLFDKQHRLAHKSFWAGPENLQRELLARLEPK